jgi:hypothetical protein
MISIFLAKKKIIKNNILSIKVIQTGKKIGANFRTI